MKTETSFAKRALAFALSFLMALCLLPLQTVAHAETDMMIDLTVTDKKTGDALEGVDVYADFPFGATSVPDPTHDSGRSSFALIFDDELDGEDAAVYVTLSKDGYGSANFEIKVKLASGTRVEHSTALKPELNISVSASEGCTYSETPLTLKDLFDVSGLAAGDKVSLTGAISCRNLP